MDVMTSCSDCGSLLDIDYEWDKISVPKSLREFEARWSNRRNWSLPTLQPADLTSDSLTDELAERSRKRRIARNISMQPLGAVI